MLRILILSLILGALNALASNDSSAGKVKEIYFSLGTHTEFYNAVQKDDSGGLRKFDIAPTLGAGMGFPIWNEWRFLPEVNWVLPQMIESSKIMVNTFMLRGDLGYDPLSWLRLRLGSSLIWQNQQGRGGTAQMNNGNATSTFYYPDENRSSLNNTLDVGVETILDQYSLRLQTYFYSVFKEEQRQISYTLFFTYYWEK
jgi:hypothetical protein